MRRSGREHSAPTRARDVVCTALRFASLRLLHTTADTRPHFRMTVMYICSRVCVCLASERAPTTPFTCVESVLASEQRSARSRMGVLFLACLVAVQYEPFIIVREFAPAVDSAKGGHRKKRLQASCSCCRRGPPPTVEALVNEGGRHLACSPFSVWYHRPRGKRWELARQRCCRRPS